ncbi:WG repeat-containing protein [Massilia aquatica]|uniref:WG repeat-containing protein n=1 Tax=Massilia aquatica TaxID=2609000 RepID=A0ABX0MAY1_9BURK|nr:WG repeat-containing protein [Massilia aquatica]NHZ44369.1 WG repeat-containing protein [Massilia aquatica]
MPKQPILIENHLETGPSSYGLLMVHEGRVITYSPPLATVTGAFCEDGRGGLIAAARTQGGGAGYINASGDWLVAPDLADARSFGAGTLARYCEDGLWGYMGLYGTPAIAPRWRLAQDFQHGLAAVLTGPDTWRYIDQRGQFAFAGELANATAFSANGMAAARPASSEKFGYLNRHGAWVIEPCFAAAMPFAGHPVAPAAREYDRFGLIDAAGAWLAQPVHRYIAPFNADGLAWCTGAHGDTYLDTNGNQVFALRTGLSRHMVNGVVRAGADTYLTRHGVLAATAGIGWGTEFNEHGMALALTLEDGHMLDREGQEMPGWGILRTDGRFTLAPPESMEPFPLDPRHGSFLAPQANTPLAVFVSHDDKLLMLDRDARIAFRLCIEQGGDGQYSALYDDQARLLWTSPVSATLKAPERFFYPAAGFLYDELGPAGHLAEVVRAMLFDTEQKLQRLAHDAQFGIDACARQDQAEPERAHDDYEHADDEDDDADLRIAKFIRTRRRIVHFYYDKEAGDRYGCLGWLRNEHLYEVREDLQGKLYTQFGDGESDPDFIGRTDNTFHTAWPFELKTPLTDDAGVAPEAKRLWIAMSQSGGRGDGDEWGSLWLTCAPSIETLELALRARSRRAGAHGADRELRSTASPRRWPRSP